MAETIAKSSEEEIMTVLRTIQSYLPVLLERARALRAAAESAPPSASAGSALSVCILQIQNLVYHSASLSALLSARAAGLPLPPHALEAAAMAHIAIEKTAPLEKVMAPRIAAALAAAPAAPALAEMAALDFGDDEEEDAEAAAAAAAAANERGRRRRRVRVAHAAPEPEAAAPAAEDDFVSNAARRRVERQAVAKLLADEDVRELVAGETDAPVTSRAGEAGETAADRDIAAWELESFKRVSRGKAARLQDKSDTKTIKEDVETIFGESGDIYAQMKAAGVISDAPAPARTRAPAEVELVPEETEVAAVRRPRKMTKLVRKK